MTIAKGCIFLLLGVSLSLGCVSHTERVPYRPHLMPQDEGLWTEVKREFGWPAARKTNKPKKGPVSLSARMVRRVKDWFTPDTQPEGPDVHPQHWQRINEEYEQERKRLGLY